MARSVTICHNLHDLCQPGVGGRTGFKEGAGQVPGVDKTLDSDMDGELATPARLAAFTLENGSLVFRAPLEDVRASAGAGGGVGGFGNC
jgi:hypothetical protein